MGSGGDDITISDTVIFWPSSSAIPSYFYLSLCIEWLMNNNQLKLSRADLAAAYSAKSVPGLSKRGDKYYVGDKEVVPAEEVQSFLRSYYDDPATGFIGRDRLFAKVFVTHLGISKRDVEAFLRNNETSQVHSAPKNVTLSRPLVPSAPMKSWCVDLTWLKDIDPDSTTTVERESQCVLTVIDVFSKKGFARIIPNKTAATVAKAMREVLEENGSAPSVIRTDNGSEFISKDWAALCSEYKIKHITGDTYTPKQQSHIERWNRTLKMAIYRFQTQWKMAKISNKDLQKIVWNYNHCVHGTTKQVPADLHDGAEDWAVKAARGEMRARAKRLLRENEHNFPKLRVGDTVRVAKRVNGEWRKSRTFKKYSYMSQYFYELYKVSEITQPTAVKNSMYRLVGIDRWFLRQDLLKVDPKSLITELDRGEYVVENVTDKRTVEGKVQYLVKFRGHKKLEWIAGQKSFQSLIDKFEKTHVPKAKAEEKPPSGIVKKRPKRVTRVTSHPVVTGNQKSLSSQLKDIVKASAEVPGGGRVTRSALKRR
jgi:transposase InsO family protein